MNKQTIPITGKRLDHSVIYLGRVKQSLDTSAMWLKTNMKSTKKIEIDELKTQTG